MSNSLATYLDDHLTGARFAVELIASLRDQHAGAELGAFADELLAKVETDRALLQQIAEQVGGGVNPLREASAWLAEKASRLKLRFGADPRLGTLEALETLSLGILGKRALWQALEAIAPQRVALAGRDFAALAASAEEQFRSVEVRRLEAARAAFDAER